MTILCNVIFNRNNLRRQIAGRYVKRRENHQDAVIHVEAPNEQEAKETPDSKVQWEKNMLQLSVNDDLV